MNVCKCGVTHLNGVCYYKQDPEFRKQKLKYKSKYRSTRRIELSNKEKERMKDPIKHQNKLEFDRKYKQQYGYKERYNIYQKEWYKNNPNYKKEEYERNNETYRTWRKTNYAENKDKILINQHDYYWHRGGREKAFERREKNPKSNWRSEYPELVESMNNVRVRDNNTCQWQNCGKKYKRGKVSIHVHHIFPRSEYPDLELVEQYMICYCLYHHGKWHEYRGDVGATNILLNNRY